MSLAQEISSISAQLSQLRALLSQSAQALLDRCDWNFVPGAGYQGYPLMVLRFDHRVQLDDPGLLELADQIQQYRGAVDFALFSGETQTPLKVFSKTLLDRRWHWHR